MTAPALTVIEGGVPRFVDRNYVVWKDERGRDVKAPASEVGGFPFEGVLPVRPFRWHANQRNFPGLWWMATTRKHVPHESRLERDHLILLDFDPMVEAVSSQPFMLWMPGLDNRTVRAFPDFFVRRVDGSAVVIDVKNRADHQGFLDGDKSRLTGLVCDEAGWEYRVVSEPPSQQMKNVRWLARYRRPPLRFDEHRAALLDACREPMPVGTVMHRVDHPTVVLPAVMHMCWTGDLAFDLDRPLTMRSEVWPS